MTETRGGVLGWFQKPRTVSRREEVRQRVERGDWHGSEIGRQHVSFLVQSARQARTLNGNQMGPAEGGVSLMIQVRSR